MRSKIAIIALAGSLGLLAAEVVVRGFGDSLGLDVEGWRKRCEVEKDADLLHYVGSPHTLYRLNPAAGTNSMLFSDHEWKRERSPGVARIACLGGSTTQNGFGVDRETYPKKLGAILQSELYCPVEVMNWGVDGWTTAETLVNFHLNVLDYEPDVVVVLHAINDVWPRMWPDFEEDYRHYRSSWHDPQRGPLVNWLFQHSALYGVLRGRMVDESSLASRITPPLKDRSAKLDAAELLPETAGAYERNLRNIVHAMTSRGKAAVLVTQKIDPDAHWSRPAIDAKMHEGVAQHNEILRRIASETGALLVDIDRDWDADFEEKYQPEFVDIVHLTAQGNAWKAEAVARVIKDNEVLNCR